MPKDKFPTINHNIEQIIREAREISAKYDMELEQVLYLFEIDSMRMASVMIENIKSGLEKVNAILDELSPSKKKQMSLRHKSRLSFEEE